MANIVWITKYKAAQNKIIHVVEVDLVNRGVAEHQIAGERSIIFVNPFEIEVEGNRPPSKFHADKICDFTLADVQLALDIANCIHPHISYSEE